MDFSDIMGNTPLHDAAEANQVDAVKKLVEQDAAINYTNRKKVKDVLFMIVCTYLRIAGL